jgi:F-type H+-transporting ATPase subunit b
METFAGQFFWLVITFAFLFVVLWRVAGPRIHDTIAARRNKINGDLAAADQARRDAENASAAYDAALGTARSRSHALAEENRKTIVDQIDRAKAEADADAAKTTAEAEKRIGVMREQAKAHVANAARDAAVEIVKRLTGEQVSPDEAAAAVAATARS